MPFPSTNMLGVLMVSGGDMSKIRDFIYIDSEKLHSFVSQIQGGLVSEINETIRQLGGVNAGIELRIPTAISAKVEGSKNKETERQQLLQMTDPALFWVLQEYLKKNKEITDLSLQNKDENNSFESGQFIEVDGIGYPPTIENWIERVNTAFSFFEKHSRIINQMSTKEKDRNKRAKSTLISTMQIKQFREMLDLLFDYIRLSRKDPGIQYIKVKPENLSYCIWCNLLKEYSSETIKSIFPTNIHLFGRVERQLKSGEVFKIVDLSMFNKAADVSGLIEILNGFNKNFNEPEISLSDLQASENDLFVSPTAIYR